MSPAAPSTRCSAGTLAALALLLQVTTAAPAVAAPVLASADARIVFGAPTACEVTLTLAVSGATEIEHRLESLEGSRTELIEVSGGTRVGDVREIGRTQSLVVRPTQPTYTIHYRVAQSADRPHRCPLWLPTAPADGRSRSVRMRVTVPAGNTANGTMPSFAWTGTVGSATLPHLPAFVIVPYAASGSARPWDVSRVMDAVAIGTLALASAVWLRRQKGCAA